MDEAREWIANVTGGASARQIAAALGEANSTVHRWFRDNKTPPEAVIDIARVYGADPVRALATFGFLTEQEVEGRPAPLARVGSLELVAELHRRLVIEGAGRK